jgi:hypothetical protein
MSLVLSKFLDFLAFRSPLPPTKIANIDITTAKQLAPFAMLPKPAKIQIQQQQTAKTTTQQSPLNRPPRLAPSAPL